MDSPVRFAEFTAYEVLGYWIPGATLGALTFAFLCPEAPRMLQRVPTLEASWWVLLALGAYLLGHLVQAVTNLMPCAVHDAPPWEVSFGSWTLFTVRDCLTRAFGPNAVAAPEVFHLCDAHVQRCGCFPEREMLTYREGFYRGMWAASLLGLVEGAVGYVLRGTVGLIPPAWGLLPMVAVWTPLALASLAFYWRFVHFRCLRLKSTYLSFCECELASDRSRGGAG